MNFDPVNKYDSLLDLLEEEVAGYRSLLSVLEREKKAIMKSNLDELEKTGKEKETLLQEIRTIEEQRQNLIECFAESLGCTPHELTITKLAGITEAPYSGRFHNFCFVLLPLAKTVHEANGAIKALLMHSVELIKSSLAFLNNLIAAHDVYYRSGRMRQNDQGGKVLCGSI